MDDPYAWLPPCAEPSCGHPYHVHELKKAGGPRGQNVRAKCSCGCKTYKSPDVPRESRCPTCGAPREAK